MKYDISQGGVVVNTIVSDPANIAALAAVIGGTYAEVIDTPPPAPGPTTDEVNAERTRRIEAGTDISLPGYAVPVALQGREKDQISLLGLKDVAKDRIDAADTTTITKFRDRKNEDHLLTPPQMVTLWRLGAAWMGAVHEASVALKDANPIPADYANNEHWPA
ncbi:hypothetical protein [Candidatus Halocynthiibacter alkanivorans]|uniref:DUF4376 domain-containing protein n=1 Tax=Candidatus Halocynthiibacter alkanivorans TaxID=2267619 RepID=UPI000DF14C8E|nr:hypothetical protein [Candidatus Halocynthiibacter alkanivorans]